MYEYEANMGGTLRILMMSNVHRGAPLLMWWKRGALASRRGASLSSASTAR